MEGWTTAAAGLEEDIVEAQGSARPAARRSWPSYAAHTRAVVAALAPNATIRVVHFSQERGES
eukprot:1715976-Prymnesium_polylepis.1